MSLRDALAGNVDIVFLDGFESGCGNLVYSEPFTLTDGSSWPTPWTALGNVQMADIQQQMARLQPAPTSYSLARMGAAVTNSNVEVRFTLRFEDVTTQGAGFYVRQNGGYLMQTTTHGQGYGVFIEGTFRSQPGIGLWEEIDGTESNIAHAPAPLTPLVNDTDYRVRFQVQQQSPTQTLMRAKLWLTIDAEPTAWQVSITDATPVLQDISGSIAIDSWSSFYSPMPITTHTFTDNIELISLCD